MGIRERKARERHARPEAILKTAQKIFFAKGLDQTRVVTELLDYTIEKLSEGLKIN